MEVPPAFGTCIKSNFLSSETCAYCGWRIVDIRSAGFDGGVDRTIELLFDRTQKGSSGSCRHPRAHFQWPLPSFLRQSWTASCWWFASRSISKCHPSKQPSMECSKLLAWIVWFLFPVHWRDRRHLFNFIITCIEVPFVWWNTFISLF